MTEQVYHVGGVKICSSLNTNLKTFCMALYIRAGSMFEDFSDNGISHLFEHAVFRNMKNKYDGFYDLLARHCVELRGCTYKEFTRFTITGPGREFDFAVQILCDIFDEISLSKLELDKEKKRIKAEIREYDERSSVDYWFNGLVWKNTEAQKSVLGYCKNIDRISVKKLNEFRKEFFVKNNLFIYVTGNVMQSGMERLFEMVNKLDMPQGGAVKTNYVTVNSDFFCRKCAVNVKNGYWNYIRIGFDVDHSKYSSGILDLLYAILFNRDKALVHNYLSEDNPIIYSYDSTFELYDNIGNLSFKFEVDKTKAEDAVGIVVRMLNDVKSGNFDFEANLKSEMYTAETEIDKPDELNWSMAYYNHILRSVPINYDDNFYGRFGVTKEQLINAAKDIFRTCNMTVAIKGNKKSINTLNIEDILKKLDIPMIDR